MDWISEYAEREWNESAFLSAKDLEACLRDFHTEATKRLAEQITAYGWVRGEYVDNIGDYLIKGML